MTSSIREVDRSFARMWVCLVPERLVDGSLALGQNLEAIGTKHRVRTDQALCDEVIEKLQRDFDHGHAGVVAPPAQGVSHGDGRIDRNIK